MAKKYIIELEAKTDQAISGIEDLKKEITRLNEQVVTSNKQTAEGFKNVEKASKNVSKGLGLLAHLLRLLV